LPAHLSYWRAVVEPVGTTTTLLLPTGSKSGFGGSVYTGNQGVEYYATTFAELKYNAKTAFREYP